MLLQGMSVAANEELQQGISVAARDEVMQQRMKTTVVCRTIPSVLRAEGRGAARWLLLGSSGFVSSPQLQNFADNLT